MPWWQTMPLRLLAHTVPETTVTGEGMEIQPSDNKEMLQALGLDPLIIKETRIDAIYGLTNLMQAALINSKALKMPALILYGAHDEIIPAESFCEMLNQLPDKTNAHWRLIYYPNGYHMLSRDLQAKVVMLDMVMWMHDQSAKFPSGLEVGADMGQGESDLSLSGVCADL
jgi:alpha-beta hydrolase superfamily lysophospholipase